MLEKQDFSMMESTISDRFISERILHKLKETLQAQSTLPSNDLSIQLPCMQAAISTLLEVKNILDSLSKTSLRNVADNLANSDGHFVIQRYLIKSYYFLRSDGNTLSETNILDEAEDSRPSGVLIFCPLYVAVTEVVTHLLASQTFASSIASTKIIQLLLKDLNVLVLPSSEPEQFKMLLANIHFLWELSKNPAGLAQFQNFSDTVLILINVFVSYQGPFEQLTTLVKSLAIIIAAEVADEETNVYLLAEESCLDFVVEILTKSVSAGDMYLNYQGVYAVDIAKCIENLSRFEGLQEALLGKGVVELLVSMIQIGDPHDDSSAARALNKLVRTQGTMDAPVLLQGLVSYCEKDLSTNKREISAESDDQRKPIVTEKETAESLSEVQGGRVDSLDKNKNTALDSKEEVSSEVPQRSIEEGNTDTLNKTENFNNVVSDNGSEIAVGMETFTAELKPNTNTIASTEEKPKVPFLEKSDCDVIEDQESKKVEDVGVIFKDNIEENVATNTTNEPSHGLNDEEGICDQDTHILCDETEDRKAAEMPEEKNLPQISSTLKIPCTEDPNQPHKPEPSLNQQEISAYIKKQLENVGEEEIKYIKIPAVKLEPDISKQPDSECKQSHVAARPFEHQENGTDPVSGQDLHRIHSSLIDLGVHNMYDEKLVGLLNKILEETKLREDGVFDILNSVPDIYSYKMLRTGSMQRQLRIVPAYNDDDINVPLIHVQPEIDYHLVLKKFIFQVVQDHGSKMDFPGFTLIGPWYETIPAELEEWSFCFVPHKSTEGKTQYFLSAERMKTNFLLPICLSFVQMNIQYKRLVAMGESVERENLKRHGITVRKIEENGPAVTVYYFDKYLTIDYVLSLRHIQWPSCAASWPDRQRQWPDNDTVKDITNYGCHLVPKQPACLSEGDPLYGMFFQYSFASAENILLNKLNDDNPVLTDCLRMLKFLCELHFDRPKLLKSYHMQTVVLLAAERLPLSHWKANNFVKHLLDLLDDLLHYLVAHNLPNYFVPQQNLLQQFAPDFILDVAARVSKVRRNPIKYLTPSSDPARFGIYLI